MNKNFKSRSGHRPSTSTAIVVMILLFLVALSLAGCGKDDGEKRSVGKTSTSPAMALHDGQKVDAVRILLDQAGLYQVSGEQLGSAGFDLAAGEPDQLVLSLGGQPVPMTIRNSGADRDITFYGRPRESRYGDQNAYRLEWAEDGENPATGIETIAVTAAKGEPVSSFRQTSSLEESHHYLSQTPVDTDHWLWQSVFAPGEFAVPFDLPGWVGGDVDLEVSLWANTESPETPDHHTILKVNEQIVDDSSWDGRGWETLSATVPASALKPVGNELVIEAPGDTDAIVDVVYLDRVDMIYDREMVADQGRLRFQIDGGDPAAIQGLDDTEVLLWDVSEADQPRALEGFELAGNSLSFQNRQADGPRTYAVADSDARLTPLAIEPVLGADLRENPEGADYIAVVHPDFEEALQPLMEFRRSQGYRVTVASIADVYDSFSDGNPDPAAIRDYMIYASENWPDPAPRFLLLVGDASYDFKGFTPDATSVYVPTYLMDTHFVGETASDNWFVTLDGKDGKPDMAVGRIPAQTAGQVETVVAKTLAYERDPDAAQWSGRALFVADDKQDNFQAISDDLANDYLPDSYSVSKVYLGETDDPGDEIMESLNQGVGLVTYVGHGSMNVWAQEKIFQTDDVQSLENDSALPFMMTMTCLVGYFHHPQATSMGEELLFKTDGGVVAALVPTSESLADDQRDLAVNIYTHLFEGADTVGEAIMLGKKDLILDRDIMQDLIETFTLLGDPALVFQRPGG
ncbi:MAG: C25 family cysteine peptidase [Chloroflexota bacterium]|nr:C25 family cysteine peptidase [Chloroflexota bacterium]